MRLAIAEARDTIVTIGVMPTHAETGFGYIRLGARLPRAGADAVHDVGGFYEKPDRPTAERYVASGEYLWNSGMFFLTARRMLDEARRHLPALGALLDAAAAAADPGDGHRVAGTPTRRRSRSITASWRRRAACASFPARSAGTTSAAGRRCPRCARPTSAATSSSAARRCSTATATSWSPTRARPTSACWACAISVVVATKDAVLVIPKDRAQDVRRIVEAAKQSGRDDLL